MDAQTRRKAVLDILRLSEKPLSAAAMAVQFHVSRQIIVGDVALLRAAGYEILSTPRGYTAHSAAGGPIRRVVCRHSGEEIESELYAMVDQGCTVLDVIVEHPVYGQLTGELQLSSRYDVKEFLHRLAASDAHPLSDLTGGIHLHTLSCPSEEAWERTCQALRELRILLED